MFFEIYYIISMHHITDINFIFVETKIDGRKFFWKYI